MTIPKEIEKQVDAKMKELFNLFRQFGYASKSLSLEECDFICSIYPKFKHCKECGQSLPR